MYRYLQTRTGSQAATLDSAAPGPIDLASAPAAQSPTRAAAPLPPSPAHLDSAIPPRSDMYGYMYMNTCAFPVLPPLTSAPPQARRQHTTPIITGPNSPRISASPPKPSPCGPSTPLDRPLYPPGPSSCFGQVQTSDSSSLRQVPPPAPASQPGFGLIIILIPALGQTRTNAFESRQAPFNAFVRTDKRRLADRSQTLLLFSFSLLLILLLFDFCPSFFSAPNLRLLSAVATSAIASTTLTRIGRPASPPSIAISITSASNPRYPPADLSLSLPSLPPPPPS
ncbi:hypothetical protein V8C44DRAFT_39696 [Trichoderma aethiopicum]